LDHFGIEYKNVLTFCSAGDLGVPGYSHPYKYNVINLAFWTQGGPADAALVWSNALTYCSAQNPWGNTTAAIQKAWADRYEEGGRRREEGGRR
jgi:hypothetical protein